MSAAFRPGWIPFDDRTAETHEQHERAVGDMPRFRICNSTGAAAEKKIVLTDVWTHPRVEAALGFKFPRVHQLTGSCVGAGGGNCLFTLSAIEVIRLGDRERIVVPFWLLPYGMSRKRAGMRGRGEGSIGSTFAESARLDGWLDAREPGLPGFTVADGLVWSERAEMDWSDGAAIPAEFLARARTQLVRSTAPCESADDVRDAIQNYYPCTAACDGYVGRARVQGTGADAVLVGDVDSRGGHQTSIQGWMEHPTFGELFLYQNQWPEQVYPRDPAGGGPCSCWISRRRMDWICKTGEVFAFSQFEGFPEQRLDRELFRLL